MTVSGLLRRFARKIEHKPLDRIYRFAQPVVPGAQTTLYARVTDPVRLSFGPDGTLFVGRDNIGSGGGNSDAVKIHRAGPGGSPVEEYGNAAITDPDHCHLVKVSGVKRPSCERGDETDTTAPGRAGDAALGAAVER